MSARTMIPLRIHYRAPGRTFAACTIAPTARHTSAAADVTCERCRDAIARHSESTRPLPPIRAGQLWLGLASASGARTT